MLGNYSNNHLGLRVEKEAKDPLQPNAPPAIFRTLWNGRHAFQDSDLSGNTLSRYENDGRHTVSFWSSTDGSQALHHDALGSITATTDNSGQLKSETVYDAFGNIASRSGLSANKFGYTGHQMDQETGLIYFQARYYDPQTGRFITQDPYEGDWNTPLSLHHYLYAYGNPTTYIDLHGYQSRKPYYMSIDPVTGQKTFSDRQPAPNTEQQAANNIAREQERARKTLADKTRPSNNIDDPEFVQRRLTREAAHKPGIGGDEVEELPSQIQLRQMHARGKLALQIGGEIAEVAAPTPETIIAGPLLGGILNKAKPLLPFLKEAAKDALKAKKTEQSLAKIETAEMNSAEKVVAKAGETESTAIGKEAHRIEAERRRASGQFSTVNEAVTDKGGATIQVPHRVNLKTGDAVDARLQNAIPDAVNYERRLIVDDKPIGRPISKDRQELIRNIEAFRKREGHLPDTIAIQRYDPKTGDPVVTELYKPEDFLPKPKK
ncbi:RHS repeat domain-containing protein [Undibacterium sp. Ji22W]|uniref:RHS repeat domain-containing protein n=1 Tax=Undibacterium sp. Ji22W TaxID=3413038 RepID=UPI003BEF8E67